MKNMTGEELKEMRTKMRLTQKDLASRLDVTEASVYAWENNKNKQGIPRTVELAMKQIRRELIEADAQDL